MQSKVYYAEHPVAPERKQELRSMGFVIRDIKFATDEQIAEAESDLDQSAKTKSAEISRDDISDLSKKQVSELLVLHGIDEPKGKVADMRDQLEQIMFVSL